MMDGVLSNLNPFKRKEPEAEQLESTPAPEEKPPKPASPPKGSVIYEPKGKAREYAPLALNLYEGCVHGCTYCYAPRCLHVSPEQFHAEVRPRKDILERLERDCARMHADPRQILLCFSCDPYPPPDQPGCKTITWKALDILGAHEMNCMILTKAGIRASRDFERMREFGFTYGISVNATGAMQSEEFEPHAPPVTDRLMSLYLARNRGLTTFVSVEPVIDPAQGLAVIKTVLPHADKIAVGKINYNAKLENRVDWDAFLREAKAMLKGTDYYIKHSLRDAAEACRVQKRAAEKVAKEALKARQAAEAAEYERERKAEQGE